MQETIKQQSPLCNPRDMWNALCDGPAPASQSGQIVMLHSSCNPAAKPFRPTKDLVLNKKPCLNLAVPACLKSVGHEMN